MKLTALLLLVASMTGVSLASPHHHRYGAGLGQYQQQSSPTSMDIHQICTLARSWGQSPYDVFQTHCRGQQGGEFQYGFCRLSPDLITNLACPPSRSVDVIFANRQQQLYDPAVIDFLQKLAQFCFLVQDDALQIPNSVIYQIVEQFCLEAPRRERISQVLPQIVDETAEFCYQNWHQSLLPQVLLSTVHSKCEGWGNHLKSECISRPELCVAIVQEP